MEEQNNDTIRVEHLDPKVLAEAIEIARKLQIKMENGADINAPEYDLLKHKEILFKLLQYLVLNQNNPNMDASLIAFLEKALNISKSKDKDKNKEREEEKEEKLTEEQKKLRYQRIMYEAYKILNPERIAGETSLDNFISNVITRGISVAREYDGAQYERDFTKNDLGDLESYKESFVNKLKSAGQKGGGRGL
jgi:hypothetical protein